MPQLTLVCKSCGDPAYFWHKPEGAKPRCRQCGGPLGRVSESSSMPARPEPVWIGRYQLIKTVAQGGMGIVYLARDPDLRRLVAVKVLHFMAGGDQDLVSRLQREAQLTASMTHPGIVSIHEVGVAPGGELGAEQHYIVMDYVEGKTLDEHVFDLELAPRVALLEQVARAVGHAHAQGIVHRDLKPENVIVRPDGKAVVMDFGLARLLGEQTRLTKTGETLGTLHYMSPEQALGLLGKMKPQTDVWALGVMLYELMTDSRPFSEGIPIAIFEKIRRQEPVAPTELVAGLPQDLETICLRALEKTQARRYADATAFAEDLRRFLNQEPIASRPPGRLYRFNRWLRQNPRPVLALLVGLLLCVGITTTGLWRSSQRELEQSRRQQRTVQQARRAMRVWETQRYGVAHDVTKWRIQLKAVRQALQQTTLSQPMAHRAWSELGWIHFRLGRRELAMRALERAIGLAPESGLYHYRAGRVLIQQYDRQRILALREQGRVERLSRKQGIERIRGLIVERFEQVVRLESEASLGWRYDYARAYLMWISGRGEQSRKTCRAMAERYTLGGEEALFLLGHMTPDVGQKVTYYEQAVDRARSYFEAYVAAVYARTFMAAQLAETGAVRAEIEAHFERAIELASEGIRIDPESTDAWIARGTARMAWGAYLQATGEDPHKQYAAAVSTDFMEANRLNPQDAETCLVSGQVAGSLARYLEQHNKRKAAAVWFSVSDRCLTRAIVLTGLQRSAARAWSRRARLRLEQGKPREALVDFAKALSLDPSLERSLESYIQRARSGQH